MPSVTLSVFGFPRGAAEAAAFCHMFDDLRTEGSLARIPTEICFLGVFDTVASVGGSSCGILRKHMQLYYRWLAVRMESFEETASFNAASPLGQQDVRDSYCMLAGDLDPSDNTRNERNDDCLKRVSNAERSNFCGKGVAVHSLRCRISQAPATTVNSMTMPAITQNPPASSANGMPPTFMPSKPAMMLIGSASTVTMVST